jgi:hypothetical protein
VKSRAFLVEAASPAGMRACQQKIGPEVFDLMPAQSNPPVLRSSRDTTCGHQLWAPLGQADSAWNRGVSGAPEFCGFQGFLGAFWLGNLDSNQD